MEQAKCRQTVCKLDLSQMGCPQAAYGINAYTLPRLPLSCQVQIQTRASISLQSNGFPVPCKGNA